MYRMNRLVLILLRPKCGRNVKEGLIGMLLGAHSHDMRYRLFSSRLMFQ